MSENNEITEAGFDLTDFGSTEAFKNVLEQVGIEQEPQEEYAGRGYCWGCGNGVIITSFNPITAERYGDTPPEHGKGYAGRIGIKGVFEWVTTTTFIIQRKAEYVKGVSLNERAYI